MDSVARFYLLAARGAIKLEALGMRHSSGKSARKHWALLLGMPPKSSHAAVIERINTALEEDREHVTDNRPATFHHVPEGQRGR